MKKILIIEDDVQIVELLTIHLQDMDCQITKAHDGKMGLDIALNNSFDLIILDLMLPSMDGLEICRKLRGKEIATTILMLTAKAEEIDKIIGLEMGADDYMTKPFSIRELLARIKAMFRRMDRFSEQTNFTNNGNSIKAGALIIDNDKRKVSLQDKRIDLSPKEFELLNLLASHPGKSYSRTQLLNLIWGYEFQGYEHTVNSHINRLRNKIEPDLQNPQYILTTWGVGYRFNEEI